MTMSNTEAITAAQAAAQKRRTELAGKTTPFASWIDKVGVGFICKNLGVSKWTVYGWRRKSLGLSEGAKPNTALLADIIRLAAGDLTAVDIFPPNPPKIRGAKKGRR